MCSRIFGNIIYCLLTNKIKSSYTHRYSYTKSLQTYLKKISIKPLQIEIEYEISNKSIFSSKILCNLFRENLLYKKCGGYFHMFVNKYRS